MHQNINSVILPLGLMIIGVFVGVIICKLGLIPISIRQSRYSIGILGGKSPFDLKDISGIRNPVLTYKDVTDIRAGFVADPFMIRVNGAWFMFFEVLNLETDKGDIGLAVSQDGLQWGYKQIVLDEPYHLSYPYVFEWDNEFYMIPETASAYSVRLYRAIEFPFKWTFVKTLIEGNYFDSSIAQYGGKWWIFTSDRNDVLHLFYADDLIGGWREHPKSPIIFRNPKIARPAGRLLPIAGKIYRFTQECDRTYGYQIRAFEIIKMTISEYEEREVKSDPILRPTGNGWSGERMHHIDAHEIGGDQWIACVDGVGMTYDLRLR
jgi:hypothetical protein